MPELWTPQYPKWVASTGQILVKPAHDSNWGYLDENGRQRVNQRRALVIHTPEEDADDNEITPRYFQNPDANASTNDYTDDDGDLYEIVRRDRCAWGNGVKDAQRVWKGTPGASPPWRIPGLSYNCVTLSNEVEGRAQSIPAHGHSAEQWDTLTNWVAYNCWAEEIECDRTFVVGHYEIASHKTDPGNLDLDDLVAAAIPVLSRLHTPEPPVITNPDPVTPLRLGPGRYLANGVVITVPEAAV